MSLSKMLQEYRNKKREFPTYDELAAIASSDQCADPIVERNVSLLRQRSAVGVQKYGTTLADNKLPLRAWLNHALEEALDQANYLQAAMAEIDSDERALPPLPQYFPDVTNIRADEELRAQEYARRYALAALQAVPVQADTSDNAPWLTLAYIICADAGVPPGHISDRMKALRAKLEAPAQASNSVEFDGIKTAPVQAQEPFMFGIMGPDGKAHMDEHCVAPDAASLYDELNGLNDSPDAGYSIVPLFLAPVQPVAVPDGWRIVEKANCYLLCEDDMVVASFAGSEAKKNASLIARMLAAPAAQGDALNVSQIEDGYEGGTCIADPTRLGGTVHLHYISPEHAESAFEVIAEIIDAAIAAKAESKPQ